MSMMNRLDSLCKDAEHSARCCMESGEQMEDISEAVFAHLFNHLGHDPELKDWAMNATSRIIRKIIDEEKAKGPVYEAAPILYDIVKRFVAHYYSDMAGREEGALVDIVEDAKKVIRASENGHES